MLFNLRPHASRFFGIALLFSLHSSSHGQRTSFTTGNSKLIEKYFQTVINVHNLDRKPNFFSPDYIWHTMDGKNIRGNEDSSHTATLRWLFTAIPDVQYTIVHLISQEDIVAAYTTFEGTAKSEMFGLPAAKKKIHGQQMFFYRIKGNKITEQWEALDPGLLKAQLEDK